MEQEKYSKTSNGIKFRWISEQHNSSDHPEQPKQPEAPQVQKEEDPRIVPYTGNLVYDARYVKLGKDVFVEVKVSRNGKWRTVAKVKTIYKAINYIAERYTTCMNIPSEPHTN